MNRLLLPITAALLFAATSAPAGTLLHREYLSASDISRNGDQAPHFQGAICLESSGDVALPGKLLNVILPPNARLASFDHRLEGTVDLGSAVGLPAVPSARSSTGQVSSVAGARSGELVLLGQAAISGRRVAIFYWRPLSILGGNLRLRGKLELEITTAPDDDPPLRRLRPPERGHEPFRPTERPSLDGSPVDAVIITDEEMLSAFQPLADWHTARGTRTLLRSTEWIAANYAPGADRAENIRFFLQDAYQLWGLRAVLLGGDTEIIPPRYSLSYAHTPPISVPTDLYYSCLDGNWNGNGNSIWCEAEWNGQAGDEADLYPELMIGRLPARDAVDAAALVSKIIGYRETARTDFQQRLLLFAEVLYPADWTPGETIYLDGASYAADVIDETLDEEIEALPLFENWEDPLWAAYDPQPLSVEAAFDSLDSGRFSVVNQNGHGFRYNMSVGDGSIEITDAAALTNDPPFHITLMNCTSSAYDYDCLAENFLLNPDGGAVSVFGASRTNYPEYSFVYEQDFHEYLFRDDICVAGENIRQIRLERAPGALYEGINRWTYLAMIFLGDPLLDLWAGDPRDFTVTAPDSLAVGGDSVLLHVESGAVSVMGARLTLRQEGGAFVTGETDAGGDLLLSLPSLEEGTATLTVWGVNGMMQTLTIPVVGSATAVVHALDFEIDDGVLWSPLNNANGVLDAGETCQLLVDLHNAGGDAAGNVSVQMSSLHDSLTVIESAETYGDLPADAVLTGTFEISAAPGTGDGTLLPLLAEISADGLPSRTDTLLLDLAAPDLNLVVLRLSDALPDGDGDGVIEPGENFRALPCVANLGGGASGELNLFLSAAGDGLSILDSTATISGLSLLDEGSAAGGFLLALDDPGAGATALMTLIDGCGREQSWALDFREPAPPANLDSSSGLAADRIDLVWTAPEEEDLLGFHVYLAQHEAVDFTRRTLLPIEHATCVLDDLDENSLTWFYVTAVDSGGLESVASDTLATSTNPSQNAGFPQELQQSSSTSVAIGNVAGDDGLELVTAADYVYAWYADGNELRDGDASSATNGLFSLEARDMAGAVTLAPFLGNGYEQIAVASRGSNPAGPKAIYLFDGDGSILPGWPRATQEWIWVNLIACDLDGNQDLELVGLDILGNLYAFHHNGQEVADGDGNPSTIGILRTGLGSWITSCPAVADLNNDGDDEIVIMGSGGYLFAVDGDGTDLPGFPLQVFPSGWGGAYKSKRPVLIANLDGDLNGELEIVVHSEADLLYAWHADGTELPGWPLPLASEIADIGAGAVPMDLDNDGDLELFVVETPDYYESRLHLLDHDGSERPGWPLTIATSSQSSPLVGDVDGDGEVELMLGTELGVVYGFNLDASNLAGFPIDVGGEVRGTPALSDLDGDGDVELILSSWNRRVLAWDLSGAWDEAIFPWTTLSGNYRRTGLFESGFLTVADSAPLPRSDRLLGNWPNPFNPSTTIRFELASAGSVKLQVIDLGGRIVARLASGVFAAGSHELVWRADRAASGVYFLRLETEAGFMARKMILLK